MSPEVAIAIVSTLASGSFALLGVAFGDRRAQRRERDAFSRETALELAGMERLVWGDNWIELQAHLQRQEARMTVAGVPNELVQAFHEISERCWRDLQRSSELSAEESPGIKTELLNARRAIHRAIRGFLLNERGKAALSSAALREVRAALESSSAAG